MTRLFQVAVTSLLATSAAQAQPGADDPELSPPSEVPIVQNEHPLATHSPIAPPAPEWGGGFRITGLSGIGALPGVNYGGELSGQLRHDELFASRRRPTS